jgi:putative ABC transport system permease protein
MNKVLRKRLLRELKSNFARYAALVLLIVFGMYVIVAVVSSADTIIVRSDEHGEMNRVEDGQFGVFIPLTDEQEKQITDMGVTLERHFSIDVFAGDGSKLRVFKNRSDIDLVELDSGRYAEKMNEAVAEKRYCEEHSLAVGDRLTAGGIEFEIVGIGTTPDYDAPFDKFSDTAVSSVGFGLLFVSDEQYDYIRNDTSQQAEDLCYAYLLNGKATDEELKETIKDFEFNYKDVTDKYYLETVGEALQQRDDLRNGINELYDGSQELKDGMKDLSDGADELHSGLGELYDGSVKLTDGIDELSGGVKDALDGSKELADGAKDAYDGASELADGISELKTETDKLLDEVFDVDLDNLTMFVKRAENVRIAGAKGDVIMNRLAGLGVGVILMMLLAYVISVFVIHQIQRESSVIGALYALGAKKKDLIAHYITLPTIVAFIGGIIGMLIGFSPVGLNYQMLDTYAYFSLPEFAPVYPVYLIIYSVVMPPVISMIVNTLVINKRLSQTALSLIRNEQKTARYSSVRIRSKNFIRRFQIRQMLREMRTGITVLLSMLFSLLVLMLGVDCYYLCENVRIDTIRDTKYEYMYTLKYPESTVPEGGEACFAKTLSKEQLGYNLDVTVMGIDSDNKFYNAETHKGKSLITASKSVVERYGVTTGDKFILTDSANSMDYAFTVADTCDESAGLMVFMDIDSMRELFGEGDDYYNCVLSDEPLDIDEGRLYGTTTKTDIERSAAVFTELMMSMIVMLIVIAIIIFFAVMFLMLNVMVERASFGISLVKVFGYKTRDVKRLYLNGNALLIAIGALIEIPLSKLIIDKVFPLFIPNVTSGINLVFPLYIYPIIFAGTMAVYYVITAILVRKLGKITPAEVLKNRE